MKTNHMANWVEGHHSPYKLTLRLIQTRIHSQNSPRLEVTANGLHYKFSQLCSSDWILVNFLCYVASAGTFIMYSYPRILICKSYQVP